MKLQFVSRILWGLCCLFLLWVHISDYIQCAKHPELYPIGEGEFGWIYKSFENYVLGCRVALAWDIIGIITSVCYRFRHSEKILLVHFVLSLIIFLRHWLCLIFYCIWFVCDSWLTVKRQKLGRNRKTNPNGNAQTTARKNCFLAYLQKKTVECS